VGAHFFTPADVIPLVEVVRNDDTSEDTVAKVMATLRFGGKRPVLVRQDIPGFIANRIQHALAREAISLLEKGVASAEDIDEVVKWSLGIRLALSGPLEQRDMNGIDVHYAIASYLYKDLENRTEPSDLLKSKVDSGHLGAKSGQGFYTWSPERRERVLREKSAALGELAAWLNGKAGGS
jgi:3-hydroxybutyryl-CoA dehydrogenase